MGKIKSQRVGKSVPDSTLTEYVFRMPRHCRLRNLVIETNASLTADGRWLGWWLSTQQHASSPHPNSLGVIYNDAVNVEITTSGGLKVRKRYESYLRNKKIDLGKGKRHVLYGYVYHVVGGTSNTALELEYERLKK